MEDNGIIDYGKWYIPMSWDELTLKMYQDIERYLDGNEESFDVRKVLHILTGHSEDEINALPMEFLELVMEKTKFLQSGIEREPSNSVVISGETYTVHTENKLKVGEYIASDSIIKSDRHNYAALLAILCRQEGEVYDSKFENEVLPDRIKMWESVSVVKILPIIDFFLQLYVISTMPTLMSSKAKEAVSLIRKDIETSYQSGEISKRSMRSAMKKLKKLDKSISSI